ncbi:MAG: hypothetical protein NT092_08045 [Bacteroidia bacterium]|nr:hypothetical protein [Bacteroidia bacterium]
MKNLVVSFLIIAALFAACSKTPEKIPVTTKSETALKLYNQAIDAQGDVYLAKYRLLTDSAIKEDPDFFMAYCSRAMNYRYSNNLPRFKEFAGKAVNCSIKFSKGELVLKDALEKLLEDPNADVTEYGRKLTELYPRDERAFYDLFVFQSIIKDRNGMIETLKGAIKVSDDPAPAYNLLGYIYMSLSQFDSAAVVLDKYIVLAPGIPNPYDSKGDYFIRIKDYENAYSSFMKAHELDSLWGYKKAMYARKLADSIAAIK